MQPHKLIFQQKLDSWKGGDEALQNLKTVELIF